MVHWFALPRTITPMHWIPLWSTNRVLDKLLARRHLQTRCFKRCRMLKDFDFCMREFAIKSKRMQRPNAIGCCVQPGFHQSLLWVDGNTKNLNRFINAALTARRPVGFDGRNKSEFGASSKLVWSQCTICHSLAFGCHLVQNDFSPLEGNQIYTFQDFLLSLISSFIHFSFFSTRIICPFF